MYVRPRQLWWLLPIFSGLLLLGMALGAISNKPASRVTPVITVEERSEADRALIAEMLEQLSGENERMFRVTFKEYTLQGKFRGEEFELSGSVAGHQLQLKRSDQDVQVTIDGEALENATLPFALYTPYEHAMILKAQLHAVTPNVITGKAQEGWLGFHLSLPPEEVTALLALWLGPMFPMDEMSPSLAKRITVDYEVYYDAQSKQLKQLLVDLRMKTPYGEEQDQLLFSL